MEYPPPNCYKRGSRERTAVIRGADMTLYGHVLRPD